MFYKHEIAHSTDLTERIEARRGTKQKRSEGKQPGENRGRLRTWLRLAVA